MPVEKLRFNLEKQKELFNYYNDIIKALDILNCSGDIQLSKMENKDWESLEMLVRAFVYNEPISGFSKNLSINSIVAVENHQFFICFIKDKNSLNSYYLYDFFATGNEAVNKDIVEKDENGDYHQTSKYIILEAQDYANASNIRFDIILPSFQKYKEDLFTYKLANRVLLRLILAYDITKGERIELLETAEEFSNWIICAETKNSSSHFINILNKLQIIRRYRNFNDSEKKNIYKIIENKNATEYEIIGALILIGDYKKAQNYFEKLDKSEQEEFETFPIYNLWKESNLE